MSINQPENQCIKISAIHPIRFRDSDFGKQVDDSYVDPNFPWRDKSALLMIIEIYIFLVKCNLCIQNLQKSEKARFESSDIDNGPIPSYFWSRDSGLEAWSMIFRRFCTISISYTEAISKPYFFYNDHVTWLHLFYRSQICNRVHFKILTQLKQGGIQTQKLSS